MMKDFLENLLRKCPNNGIYESELGEVWDRFFPPDRTATSEPAVQILDT